MTDRGRTRESLIEELKQLRESVTQLRARESERRHQAQPAPEPSAQLGSIVSIRDLRESKRKAEAASKAKSEFLANMSHELRTPMTAILGYTDILLEGETGGLSAEERLAHLNTLRRNGQHLMRLLTDILDFSKIEAGKVDIEKLRTSPYEIVADVQAVMRHAADERRVGFDVSSYGDIPATIETDPTRLRQILMNLVGNAIKFTEEGGVRILVRMISQDTQSKMLFSVSDTGLGIPPDAMGRLFEKFYRVENYKRVAKGTGLGLNLCKHIVETLHHGQIGVESELGMGSKFWALIPMRYAGSQAAA